MNYHRSNVTERSATFRAHCPTCGWEGPTRDTEAAAEDDGDGHVVAMAGE